MLKQLWAAFFIMYSVYILYSASTDKFYKGQTSNLTQRLARHNSEEGSYTIKGAPWIIVWSTQKESRSDAVQLELKLKKLNRERLIRFMLKYSQGIASQDEALLVQRLF